MLTHKNVNVDYSRSLVSAERLLHIVVTVLVELLHHMYSIVLSYAVFFCSFLSV